MSERVTLEDFNSIPARALPDTQEAGHATGAKASVIAPARALALPVSSFRRERVEYLWPGRIPLGAVTVLAGDPGLGKSLLTVALAGRLSTGELTGAPRAALLATAEDSVSATIRPRLEAVNGDLELVRIVQLFRDGLPDGLRLPDDVHKLEELVESTGAALVVIDPLMAHLPAEVNSWRDQSVRLALAPLHGMAERRRCAVVVVAHLNKTMSGAWLQRIGGSIGISGAARSVLLLARDPDDPDVEQGTRRVLAHVKSNVGAYAPSLLYEIEPILIPATDEDPEVETARLVELGESHHGGEALLAIRGGGEERSQLEEAVAFLHEELAGGPQAQKDVVRGARSLGISEATLKRARKTLGVESRREGGIGDAGRWVLALPLLSGSTPLSRLEDHDDEPLSGNGSTERVSGPSGGAETAKWFMSSGLSALDGLDVDEEAERLRSKFPEIA